MLIKNDSRPTWSQVRGKRKADGPLLSAFKTKWPLVMCGLT